jgi:hypothetical protein
LPRACYMFCTSFFISRRQFIPRFFLNLFIFHKEDISYPFFLVPIQPIFTRPSPDGRKSHFVLFGILPCRYHFGICSLIFAP